MLISHNLHLVRILRYTWKVDILMVITCAVTYYIHEHLASAINIPPTLITLLGTAIAFFLGFNNNQAYDRWWEARIIWGALVNDSRSWARNLLQHTDEGNAGKNELLTITRRMILRQIGFIYSLKESLRGTKDKIYKKYLNEQDLLEVTQESNVSNAILTLQAADLELLSKNKSIDQFRFVQLNQIITSFTDSMGRCERIKNTVFPTAYVYFSKLFIWILVILATLVLSDTVGVWSILIGWIIGFVFHVTHQNGMSLMEPFDEVPTGIPLDQISRTIEINLLQMLGEKDIPPPVSPVNNEYIM